MVANPSNQPDKSDRREAAGFQSQDVADLARRERVPEAMVKAAFQAMGNDRAKVLAHLRVRKSESLPS